MWNHIRRHNRAIAACGGVTLVVGILGCGFSFLAWAMLNFTESPSFAPLAWSPDGSQLAVGAREELHSVGVYVVDSDGNDFRKLLASLCDHLPECGYGIDFIRWAEDGQTIFFGRGNSTYYAVPLEGGVFREVTLTEMPPEPATPHVAESTGTECDNVDFISTRHMNSEGLLAQSSCSGDCNTCSYTHCVEELLVCDMQTGEVVFVINDGDYALARSDYSFWARPTAMRLCVLLALTGLTPILVGLVAEIGRKRSVKTMRNPGQTESFL